MRCSHIVPPSILVAEVLVDVVHEPPRKTCKDGLFSSQRSYGTLQKKSWIKRSFVKQGVFMRGSRVAQRTQKRCGMWFKDSNSYPPSKRNMSLPKMSKEATFSWYPKRNEFQDDVELSPLLYREMSLSDSELRLELPWHHLREAIWEASFDVLWMLTSLVWCFTWQLFSGRKLSSKVFSLVTLNLTTSTFRAASSLMKPASSWAVGQTSHSLFEQLASKCSPRQGVGRKSFASRPGQSQALHFRCSAEASNQSNLMAKFSHLRRGKNPLQLSVSDYFFISSRPHDWNEFVPASPPSLAANFLKSGQSHLLRALLTKAQRLSEWSARYIQKMPLYRTHRALVASLCWSMLNMIEHAPNHFPLKSGAQTARNLLNHAQSLNSFLLSKQSIANAIALRSWQS